MSFGVSGLVIKRLADIKTEIDGAYEAKFGIDNVDLSNDGAFGQQIGVAADREASVWEILELVLAAGTETGASGILLDMLFLLLNLVRIPAAPSRTVASDGITATGQLTGTPGTIVPAGFRLETSDTRVGFLLEDEVEIEAGGTVDAIFACEDNGPTRCLTGTLTVIPTPLAGLTSATNTQDARLGNLEETDAAFRTRRAAATATVLAATSPSVVSAMLALPGVLEVRDIENRSDSPDDDGRPGHSFELVIRGGDDQEILDKIFETQPSGVESYGGTSGVSVDRLGEAQPVAFSRQTIVPIYITVDLTVDAAFPADGIAQVRDAILTYGQTQLFGDLDVSPFKIEQTIETPGISVFEMRLGLFNDPTDSAPIEIATTARAEFDSTRLVVQRVN